MVVYAEVLPFLSNYFQVVLLRLFVFCICTCVTEEHAVAEPAALRSPFCQYL